MVGGIGDIPLRITITPTTAMMVITMVIITVVIVMVVSVLSSPVFLPPSIILV